ncbi:hypothetical protein B0H14DRAFT_3452403 [Mycena olivaceomarginata]|nr:hypothetical protein B0H14DRAFT_3452403 [Mycena olivaceomarginata]
MKKKTKNGGARRQRSACKGNGPSPYIPHDQPLASVRAAITASDYFTRRKYRERAATHSENYRDRLDAAQREQGRIADAETRRARKKEARALRRKHAAGHTPAPSAKLTTPCKPAKTAPSKPKPAPAPSASRRRAISPEQEDSGDHRPLPVLFEARAPRPPRCKACGGEECPGCAFAAGTTAPISLVAMPFGAPPYDTGPLLCIPIYKADLGHEDRHAPHRRIFRRGSPRMDGSASLARQMDRYPGARTFSASTWLKFDDLWTLDCREYHNHESDSRAADKEIREEEEERRVKEEEDRVKEKKRVKEEMDYLAATRPPPVPLSPQRARQLFDRVLGPGAGTPPFALWKGPSRPIASADAEPAAMPSPPQTPPRAGTLLEHARRRTSQLQDLPAYSDVQVSGEGEAPGLYAVHAGSHNRVFNDRARAVDVLNETPGGELVFISDKQRLWQFLDRAP